MYKEMFSVIAIALTFMAFYPYIRSILEGRTKPHVFSWIIWGMATVVVCFAQLADGAGAGAWPTGISGSISLYVAWLAYSRRADITITRSDWVFFILALLSLPLWYVTSDPLWTVIILTAIDTMGFVPTFRKSYQRPDTEPMTAYFIMSIRSLFALAALEHYSLATMLFPAGIGLQCAVMVVMLWQRRKHDRNAS